MPRGYWLSIVAVVGLALAWPVQGNAVGRHDGSSAAATETTGAPKDNPQPAIPRSVQSDINRIASALEAISQKPPSTYEKRNAEAQEKVANWTPRIFVIALLEILITAAGVVLVYGTLRYSKRLFEDQKLATKAAQDAVETSRAQVRAYLTIDSAKFSMVAVIGDEEDDRSYPVIKIVVENSGQTAAKNFVWAPTIQYLYGDFFGPKAGTDTVSRERTITFDWQNRPGKVIPAEKNIEDSLFVPEMSVNQFVAGLDEESDRIMVRVMVSFEYVDTFEKKVADVAYFGGFAEIGGGIWQCTLNPTIKPSDWDSISALAMKQDA